MTTQNHYGTITSFNFFWLSFFCIFHLVYAQWNLFNTLKILLFTEKIKWSARHERNENYPLRIFISLEASTQHLHPSHAILRVF